MLPQTLFSTQGAMSGVNAGSIEALNLEAGRGFFGFG
jgi:hypothetical protein